jgi:hypothetical protein
MPNERVIIATSAPHPKPEQIQRFTREGTWQRWSGHLEPILEVIEIAGETIHEWTRPPIYEIQPALRDLSMEFNSVSDLKNLPSYELASVRTLRVSVRSDKVGSPRVSLGLSGIMPALSFEIEGTDRARVLRDRFSN